jgi:diguanylate cyclase (GGDEF)-like protein/PAS domain S-box-containing protein
MMEKEITISNRQLQAVFEQAAVGMVIVDNASNRFVKVNRHFCEMVGYSAKELLKGSIHDITHPDDIGRDLDHVVPISAGTAQESTWEKRYRKKDGAIIWARVFVTRLDPSEAGPNLRLGVIEDITDRKRMEEALIESQAFYHSLVEQLPAGVFRKDASGRYVFVSPWFCGLKGMKAGDFLGKTPQEVARAEAEKNQAADRIVKYAAKGADHHALIMQTGKPIELIEEYADTDGRPQFVHVIKIPVVSADGKVIGTQGILFDITEHRQMEEALRESENRYRELSIIDDLTRLFNSRYFYHQLRLEVDRASRYGHPLTLLLLDLDNFKAFNDTYGHVEGDRVLARLGKVIKGCLRRTDSGYRYGGEEFTVLLPMTTSTEGAVTADRLWTEFRGEHFFPAPARDVQMTVSIGIGQYKPPETMRDFVHRVDQLMYQGKKNGKDRICSE